MTKKINSITDNLVFLEIGKITRVHGLKGEVFVSLFSLSEEISANIVGQIIQIRKKSNVCLETMAQEARLHKGGMIVRLKGVEERKQAESLKEAVLFVPKQFFSSSKGEAVYLCEVLNFTVCDKKRGSLGKVLAFSDSGAQDLLLIQGKGNRQVEIPFIEEFISRIDFDLKKIQVDLPLNWPGLEEE